MWNAPDPNPAHTLPIGYYITRLQAGAHAYAQMLFTISDMATDILHNISSPSALVDAPLDLLVKDLNKVRERRQQYKHRHSGRANYHRAGQGHLRRFDQ